MVVWSDHAFTCKNYLRGNGFSVKQRGYLDLPIILRGTFCVPDALAHRQAVIRSLLAIPYVPLTVLRSSIEVIYVFRGKRRKIDQSHQHYICNPSHNSS